ncbi:hypothetical protein HRbin14_01761 [bacterium HR14]|nr:hypothetical protein HRbin14_01761 [bacterium HR14]
MKRSDQPSPHQTLAVRLALCAFHARYPCPCHDQHEWHADCEATAWCAVLTADEPDTPDPANALSEPITEADCDHLCGDVELRQLWERLSEGERRRVLRLARCAENALRQLWRHEARYYGRCAALVMHDEEGKWVEREIEDRGALESLEGALEQVAYEQLLERLWAQLDRVERAIVWGLREGRTQAEIARALGMTQQAVSKRLQGIRAKGRAILKEIRENRE